MDAGACAADRSSYATGGPRRAPFDRGSMLLRDERGEGGKVRRSIGGQSEDKEDGTHRLAGSGLPVSPARAQSFL